MNRKLLGLALLAGIGVAQAAAAQDFDDRWYLTVGAGANIQDHARNTDDVPFGTLGLGKFLTPRWSLDGELNYQNPSSDAPGASNWTQYGISLDLRRHFISPTRKLNPYLLFGIGDERSEEGYLPGVDRKGDYPAAKVGVGLQSTMNRIGLRAELAYRYTFDDDAISPTLAKNLGDVAAAKDDAKSGYGDVLAQVALLIPLGQKALAVAPPPPAPVVRPAAPVPAAPPKITIDLNGVNFDTNKATLRPDAIEILDTASEILSRYPELRVEVAGHTDLCGEAGYNQKLSEARARTVYDYLVKKGTAASRLEGPHGYGETRPLVQTPQTSPACKNETNRRTELNVL